MELLSLNHITKIYGVTRALDDVSISFEKGEVHALIGENGAGKSTFIKTLSGAIRPTEGTITIEGVTYDHLDPKQAIDLGIAVVYQELVQFEAMSVADNIFLGVKSEEGFFLNDRQRVEKSREVLKVFDCDIDPKRLVRELSIANRQIIELAKALVRNAKIIVMDEPTAAITLAEQEKLYTVVKSLREKGITVIYISHRLEELFVLCDRVSVLRDGHYITTKHISEMTQQDMVKYMVGRELTNTFVEKKPCEQEVVLELKDVTGNGVRNISLQLHKGEILGFGGLVGAGRTELMNVIYGAARKESGTILLNGEEVNFHSPTDGMKAGIGLIPEDRKQLGCFLDKPIYWNNSIGALSSISDGLIFINGNKERELARSYREKLKLKTASLKNNASSLSGGNQQKVVIAKALAALPDILIFDEPTRGIDVGARYEIYLLMAQLCEAGKSVLMVSSDMGELIGMSERIIILHEGEISGELTDKSDFNEETILGIASGMDVETARAAAKKI